MDEAALAEERKRLAIRDAESEWMTQTTTVGGNNSSGEEGNKIKIVSLGGTKSSSSSSNGSGGVTNTNANTTGVNMVISSSSSSSIVSSSNLDRDCPTATMNLDESAATNQRTSPPSRSDSATNIRSVSSSNNTNKPPQTSTKKSTSLNGGANILEDNVMSFFGNKSLDLLDSKLDAFVVNQVQTISFNYIEYDELLAKSFAKIKAKFPYTTVNIISFNFLVVYFDYIFLFN